MAGGVPEVALGPAWTSIGLVAVPVAWVARQVIAEGKLPDARAMERQALLCKLVHALIASTELEPEPELEELLVRTMSVLVRDSPTLVKYLLDELWTSNRSRVLLDPERCILVRMTDAKVDPKPFDLVDRPGAGAQ